MKKILFSSVIGVLVLAGCATPKNGQWHNELYERDYKNSMTEYYGRDFNICLSRALEAATAKQIDPRTIEGVTDLCLRQGGWFRATN